MLSTITKHSLKRCADIAINVYKAIFKPAVPSITISCQVSSKTEENGKRRFTSAVCAACVVQTEDDASRA
ncbi:hypothetical protein [Glaciimonas sp. GG7]